MILNRLRDYLLHRDLSFNKFEKSLGVSHGSISNAWKHQRNIGSNVIEKILSTYPEINAEWLLRGDGKMLNAAGNLASNLEIPKERTDEELILRTLTFFDLQSREELFEFLDNSSKANRIGPLEQMILRTWENKYGKELKTIKLQLMTLFTAHIDEQMKSEEPDADAMTS